MPDLTERVAENDGPLHVGGLTIYLVPASGRTGVRVTVERDARIVAKVPADADRDALAALIRTRLAWLYAKVNARRAEAAERPRRRFIDGEGFWYLGRSHRLKLTDDLAASPVALKNGRLHLRRDHRDTAARALVSWYVARGRTWLPNRVHPWARRMDVPGAELNVRPLGYRWGSCSHHGTVNIHWATMQLPARLIDYVLVHELAHLYHPHHTPEFWRTVGRAMTDYEGLRVELDEWGAGIWLPEEEGQ
ncbi:SprT family zinc-dependent metalloprotease [Streptomyces vastus]|uniref:SprT family zinc-dependent metalloprotease n=1 Tax=Streptomyces vastus TaxID=285451 RepID=A0ABN3RUQ5_9ACTN